MSWWNRRTDETNAAASSDEGTQASSYPWVEAVKAGVPALGQPTEPDVREAADSLGGTPAATDWWVAAEARRQLAERVDAPPGTASADATAADATAAEHAATALPWYEQAALQMSGPPPSAVPWYQAAEAQGAPPPSLAATRRPAPDLSSYLRPSAELAKLPMPPGYVLAPDAVRISMSGLNGQAVTVLHPELGEITYHFDLPGEELNAVSFAGRRYTLSQSWSPAAAVTAETDGTAMMRPVTDALLEAIRTGRSRLFEI